MSKWSDNPTWSDISGVNKGNEYAGGDGIYYSDLNIVVNNINYLYKDVASGGKLIQIYKWLNGQVTNVTYNTADGTKVIQTTTVDYTDNADGSTKQHQFETTTYLPIFPGKYISMNATSDNKKLEVKVDDTTLAQDYIKISKTLTYDSSPVIEGGITVWYPTTQYPQGQSFAWRNAEGDCQFHDIGIGGGVRGLDGSYRTTLQQIYFSCADIYFTVAKTTTDTGTIGPIDFTRIQAYPNIRINYDNQIYILQDPNTAPDGTLNYVHIDSIQDGQGGYTMTGKCFSVTVSTRAWQVVDLSTRLYEHDILLNDEASGTEIRFSIPLRTKSFFTDAEDLWNAMENKANRVCFVRNSNATEVGTIVATTFSNSKVFQVQTSIVKRYTANQLTVSDAVY